MTRIQRNVSFILLYTLISAIVMYASAARVGWGTSASLVIAGGFAAFTLVMASIAFAIQYQRHQTALNQKQKATDTNEVEATRTFEVDVPLEQAFDLALEALQTLDGVDVPQEQVIPSKQKLVIHHQDREIGRIQAGLRAKTIGIQDVVDFSRLEVQLQRLDAHTTRIQIHSEATNPLLMFDMGRHLHYVNQVALYIRKATQADSAGERLSSTVEAAPATEQEQATPRAKHQG